MSLKIEHLLFDLDGTLYPSSCGLEKEIDRRMNRFVIGYLNVNPEEASRLRSNFRQTFGTTLGWLINKYSFADIETYLQDVLPVDVGAFLRKDFNITHMLGSILLPKSILTNSPLEHARRVLDYLDIGDHFEHIFDLRSNGFQGKPMVSVFESALKTLSRTADKVLFIDDRLDSLLSFRNMGGQVLLVDEEARFKLSQNGVPSIRSIRELNLFLSDYL